MAIENRPELREVAYQLRSNDREETAAFLRSLPSLRLFVGADCERQQLPLQQQLAGLRRTRQLEPAERVPPAGGASQGARRKANCWTSARRP